MTPPFDWIACMLGFAAGVLTVLKLVVRLTNSTLGDELYGFWAAATKSRNDITPEIKQATPQGPNHQLIQMIRQQDRPASREQEQI